MAREFIDGFEAGSMELWDGIIYNGNYPQIASSISGMDGTYCVYFSASAPCAISKNIDSASEKYFAFRVKITSSSGNKLCKVHKDSTLLLELFRNTTTGYIEAYIGASKVATGTTPLNVDTVYLIEFYYKIADSGGRVVVKVNGSTDIDYTGDTKPGTDTTMNIFYIGEPSSGTGRYVYAYFDNIIIDTANWPGNTKIQAIKPTSAGNSAQWDPSSGSNWDCVDEIPPSGTDYVSTNTDESVDTYTFSDLSGSIDSVKCVQVQARALKEGSPTPTNLKLVVRTDSTNYESSSKAVPAVSPKALWNLWENNPNTSNPWSTSEVNGAEFGIKSAT